jgi:16S rRNA (uracil1498-N3)-methyltransferase
MSLRLYVGPLTEAGIDLATIGGGVEFDLPAAAARHAQVRRVQPGDGVVLFDGLAWEGTADASGAGAAASAARAAIRADGEPELVACPATGPQAEEPRGLSGRAWQATIVAMGRGAVRVRLGPPQPVACELDRSVTLAVGMPANERMDTLVEKATELGVAAIQPLLCERAVLRLDGERAERRRQHWQGVAIAAAEQCARVRVPVIEPVRALATWLHTRSGTTAAAARGGQGSDVAPLRLLLSPAPGATPLRQRLGSALPSQPVVALSGPEGGLSPGESAAALAAGFLPTGLGPRVLRADTAPLVVLVALGLR